VPLPRHRRADRRRRGCAAGAALSALDSFFDAREREPAQTAALRARLREANLPRQLWVTHQVNLAALAGRTVGMGQALWLEARADGTLGVRPFEE
jgi:hypothetical protein